MYETLCVGLKEGAYVVDKGKTEITVLGTPEPKFTRQYIDLYPTRIAMPECQVLDSQAFLSTYCFFYLYFCLENSPVWHLYLTWVPLPCPFGLTAFLSCLFYIVLYVSSKLIS